MYNILKNKKKQSFSLKVAPRQSIVQKQCSILTRVSGWSGQISLIFLMYFPSKGVCLGSLTVYIYIKHEWYLSILNRSFQITLIKQLAYW